MPEINVYQAYHAGWEESSRNPVKINLLDGLASDEVGAFVAVETQVVTKPHPFSLKIAKILATVGVAILLIYFAPGAIEYARTRLSKSEVDNLTKATQEGSGRTLPVFNPALPKTNRLNVPSIGVDTDIGEATYTNYESALKKGVWRVSDFGQPDKIGAPIILAAHRFGYLAWTNSYRHLNSFYNLPKVKVGDTVTIDWQQRRYTYGVYKTEKSTAISDYSADLILYTCESLSGEERIFVYAKLI